jgi:hypothetical protein
MADMEVLACCQQSCSGGCSDYGVLQYMYQELILEKEAQDFFGIKKNTTK